MQTFYHLDKARTGEHRLRFAEFDACPRFTRQLLPRYALCFLA